MTNPEDRLAAARQRLVEIWADPQIRAVARKHADRREVADDALQTTFVALFQLPYLDQIENLAGYFCRTLIRAVHRERGYPGPLLVDDFTRAAEQASPGAGLWAVPAAAPEDTACHAVQAQAWHQRLVQSRDELTPTVPGRSKDSARYRAVIYAAAEQILRAAIHGEPAESDSNDALRAAYPRYLDAPQTATNTRHQRLSRARADVRQLLQAVVSHSE